MIEDIVINYLQQNTGIPCYGEIPETQPDEFIVVERNSGYRRDYIDHATLFVFSYSRNSKVRACEIDREVLYAMEKLIERSDICRVDQENSFDDTDTSRKDYRYRAEYALVFYG